ncbi:MAG: RNA ligase family protein [Myxococcota bacterium]
MVERHRDAILELGSRLGEQYPQWQSVQVYGELFGGGYPHPDVPATPGVQPIQTGVYYCPEVRFCAFDLAVTLADTQRVMIDYLEAVELWESVGLPYAEPLKVGALGELLEYPRRFTTTWPDRLGLPPLEDPNLAEGIVLKPVPFVEVATPKGARRPLLKLKIAEFAEDQRSRPMWATWVS